MLGEICGPVSSKSSQQICVIFLQQCSAALVQVPNKWIGYQGWSSARLVQWKESYQKVQAIGNGEVHVLDCGINVGSTLEERTQTARQWALREW